MSGFTPKRSLREQIVEHLGQQVVGGQLRPGSAMPTEHELCEQLGVSRTVIREALKVLSDKGLIESRPKTGGVALPRQNWKLLDPDILRWEYQFGSPVAFFERLTEVRLIIEAGAAELAAQKATPAEVAEIAQSYQEMEDTITNFEAYIEADMRFHSAILRASHNELLEQIVQTIRTALIEIRVISAQMPEAQQAVLPQHRLVLEAIQTGRPAEARQAMQTLIQQVGADIRVWLDNKKAP